MRRDLLLYVLASQGGGEDVHVESGELEVIKTKTTKQGYAWANVHVGDLCYTLNETPTTGEQVYILGSGLFVHIGIVDSYDEETNIVKINFDDVYIEEYERQSSDDSTGLLNEAKNTLKLTLNNGTTININIDDISPNGKIDMPIESPECPNQVLGIDSYGNIKWTSVLMDYNPEGSGSLSMNRMYSTSVGIYSTTLGYHGTATGNYSLAEGEETRASGEDSHAEGYHTTASGECSHAEGFSTTASARRSHAEGYSTTTSGEYSHAEGYSTEASGAASHTEGYNTTASGNQAHAEGNTSNAEGSASHAEGERTTASGEYSHAEGSYARAIGNYSHAEGYDTEASIDGYYSHVEGYRTNTTQYYAHAEGVYTKASSEAQHVQGKFNIEDTESTYADIVGGGTSDIDRANIETLDWSGNLWVAGDITDGSGNVLSDIASRIVNIEAALSRLTNGGA